MSGGSADRGDSFGRALAMGDFNADGRADLAAGAPHEDLPAGRTAGAVNVVFGSAAGLTGARDQLWLQNRRGVRGRSERGDRFGYALAAGDASGNRAEDLAIGVPAEAMGGRDWAGAANVLYGGPAGLRSDAVQLWHQGVREVKGAVEPFDRFGASLLIADVDADGSGDLAAGVPGEDTAARDAGAVNVLHGSETGVSASPDGLWHQGVRGLRGAPGPDSFGAALAGGPRGG